MAMIRRALPLAVVLFATILHSTDARAQGRAIQARDGDVVLIPPEATITIGRGTSGHVKVVAHEQGGVLIVLLDAGPRPDGIVDVFYRFDLLAPFPPQHAGEGPGTIEQYEVLGSDRGPRGYGIVLPQGRILLGSQAVGSSAAAPEHIAAFQFRDTSSGRIRATFEDAERQALRGAGLQPRPTIGAAPAAAAAAGQQAAPEGPVRVGGTIRQPAKLRDVAPVVPRAARQAGVFGVVVVEITVDALGRVSNARIIRSIPLLDQAALDAVRQWEFEPTLVGGQPRPVIMTVPVTFQ